MAGQSGLVSRSLSNLVMGVSEQPAVLRGPGQSDMVSNCRQTALGFCEKRYGTIHLTRNAALPVPGPDDLFFGANFSDGTSYLFLLQLGAGAGTMQVWDALGGNATVGSATGMSYLAGTADTVGITAIKAFQAGDVIYVANPQKTVAMLGTTTPASIPAALVWIKTANPPGSPGAKYSITLDGFTATLQDSVYDQTTQWGTVDIATSLAANLVTALGGSAALYTITASESYIYIQRVNNADFTLTVSDTKGNDWTKVIKGSTQLLTDLPTKCQAGMIVTITGNEGSPQKSWYYVKFQVTDPTGSFGRGSWVECAAPGTVTSIDPATMPLQITKSGATFSIGPATWGQRAVGDTTSAPNPSFIGRQITEIFFSEDRLGVITGGNRVCMSMSGLYTQFFPLTVLAGVTDDDPIDISVDIHRSANIYHVTPTTGGCILWGDKSQFQLLSPQGTNLTPKTVQAPHLTDFECYPGQRPVSIGNYFFFLSPATMPFQATESGQTPDANILARQDYFKVQQYYFNWESQNHLAEDITAHCPTFCRSGIPRLVAAPKSQHLFQFDINGLNGSYVPKITTGIGYEPGVRVYTYYEQGSGDGSGQKAQASWSNWWFDEAVGYGASTAAAVVAGTYLNGYLYLLIYRNNAFGGGAEALYLEALPVDPQVVDDSFTAGTGNFRQTHLDRKVAGLSCAPSYNGGSNLTTWTLPYPARGGIRVVNVSTNTWVEIPCNYTLGSTTVTATGNFATTATWLGQQYEAIIQPSQQFVKDYRGNLDTSGRIQYLRWRVTYEGTGELNYRVQSGSRNAVSGPIVTADSTLPSGQADFPVLGRSTDTTVQLYSYSWLPMKIATIEWWANYFTPFTRIL